MARGGRGGRPRLLLGGRACLHAGSGIPKLLAGLGDCAAHPGFWLPGALGTLGMLGGMLWFAACRCTEDWAAEGQCGTVAARSICRQRQRRRQCAAALPTSSAPWMHWAAAACCCGVRLSPLHPLLTALLADDFLRPTLLQCHTAVVDLFLELEDEPSFFKRRSSEGGSEGGKQRSSSGSEAGRQLSSSGSEGGRQLSSSKLQPEAGVSKKMRGMVGVGVASLGAMAAFYG